MNTRWKCGDKANAEVSFLLCAINKKIKKRKPVTCHTLWLCPTFIIKGIFPSVQESFPVRNDLSDLSDEDIIPEKMPEPMKPTVLSFKSKNENDLFGLGFENKAATNKESSDEQDGKSSIHFLLNNVWYFLFVFHSHLTVGLFVFLQ